MAASRKQPSKPTRALARRSVVQRAVAQSPKSSQRADVRLVLGRARRNDALFPVPPPVAGLLRSILQQLAAQLPSVHHMVLLDGLYDQAAQCWYAAQASNCASTACAIAGGTGERGPLGRAAVTVPNPRAHGSRIVSAAQRQSPEVL